MPIMVKSIAELTDSQAARMIERLRHLQKPESVPFLTRRELFPTEIENHEFYLRKMMLNTNRNWST
jgi:hypothetical protein